MTLNKGGLIGAALLGGAALAALIISSKKKKKQYVEPKTGNTTVEESACIKENENEEIATEEVDDVSTKVAMWVLENNEKIFGAIEKVGTLISVGFTILQVIDFIKTKRSKTMVTLDKKQFDDFLNERMRHNKDKINDEFLNAIVKQGGTTLTRTDGVRMQMIVLPKGDPA